MPNKMYPTDVLKQAQDVLSAWNQVGPTTTLGTMTATTFTADVTAVTTHEALIKGLEAQLTDARNKRDVLFNGLWDKVKRVRNGVRANYGDDSSQLEMFGATRTSERKSPTRKVAA